MTKFGNRKKPSYQTLADMVSRSTKTLSLNKKLIIKVTLFYVYVLGDLNILYLFKSFECCGFLFRDSPLMSSFRMWNPRIRNLYSNEDDWDKELEYLDLFNNHSYRLTASTFPIYNFNTNEEDSDSDYEEEDDHDLTFAA